MQFTGSSESDWKSNSQTGEGLSNKTVESLLGRQKLLSKMLNRSHRNYSKCTHNWRAHTSNKRVSYQKSNCICRRLTGWSICHFDKVVKESPDQESFNQNRAKTINEEISEQSKQISSQRHSKQLKQAKVNQVLKNCQHTIDDWIEFEDARLVLDNEKRNSQTIKLNNWKLCNLDPDWIVSNWKSHSKATQNPLEKS